MIVGTDFTATRNTFRDLQPQSITPQGYLLTLHAAKIEAWLYTPDKPFPHYPFECWVDPKRYHDARRLARRYFYPWMFRIYPLEFPS